MVDSTKSGSSKSGSTTGGKLKDPINIIFLGDMMLGRLFDNPPGKGPNSNNIWSDDIRNLFSNSLVCANLETSVTSRTDKWPKKAFNFKISPLTFPSLLPPTAGYVFNLANNHSMDYKESGLIDTMSTLDKNGFRYYGAGLNASKAETPLIFTYKQNKFGFIGISDHPKDFQARKSSPGIHYLDIDNGDEKYGWKETLESVSSTAKQVECLIVYLHYGPNWVKSISSKIISFCHALVDNGADFVCVTSPHHILPIERYKTGTIFYSLGDIIDDYAVDKIYRNDLGFIACVRLSGPDSELDVYPTRIKDMTVRLLSRTDAEDKDDYSHVLGIIKQKM